MTAHQCWTEMDNVTVRRPVGWFVCSHFLWAEMRIFRLLWETWLFQVKGLKSKGRRESLMSKVTCELQVFFFGQIFRSGGKRFHSNLAISHVTLTFLSAKVGLSHSWRKIQNKNVLYFILKICLQWHCAPDPAFSFQISRKTSERKRQSKAFPQLFIMNLALKNVRR